MSFSRSRTDRWAPRRIFLVVSSANQRSIHRPSGVCQGEGCWSGMIFEPAEVAVDAGDDAFVAGGFGVPSPCLGVVAECVDVGELRFEGGLELGGGDVVVALFADVGVG